MATTPKTLPADFQGWDPEPPSGALPPTLPADFKGFDDDSPTALANRELSKQGLSVSAPAAPVPAALAPPKPVVAPAAPVTPSGVTPDDIQNAQSPFGLNPLDVSHTPGAELLHQVRTGQFADHVPQPQPVGAITGTRPMRPEEMNGTVGQVFDQMQHPPQVPMAAPGPLHFIPQAFETADNNPLHMATAGLEKSVDNAVALDKSNADTAAERGTQAPSLLTPFLHPVEGGAQAVAGTANALTSTSNLGLLATLDAAPEAIQRAASAYFAKDMAEGAFKQGAQALEEARQGKTKDAVRDVTGAVLSGAMAHGAGKHALSEHPVVAEPEVKDTSTPQVVSEPTPADRQQQARVDTAGVYRRDHTPVFDQKNAPEPAPIQAQPHPDHNAPEPQVKVGEAAPQNSAPVEPKEQGNSTPAAPKTWAEIKAAMPPEQRAAIEAGKEAARREDYQGVAAAREAARRPELEPDYLKGKDTETAFKRGPGFTPDRQRLHADILDSYGIGSKPEHETPTLVLLGGGAASGKSGVAARAHEMFPDAVQLDPDGIKAKLPEYSILQASDPLGAAARTHEESSYLSKVALASAMQNRHNIILDAVSGDANKIKTEIAKFKRAGYRVEAHFVDAPIDQARERAMSRFEKTGRWVPPDIQAQGHRGAAATYHAIHPIVDQASLHENIDAPVLLHRSSNGEGNLVNPERFREHLTKGGQNGRPELEQTPDHRTGHPEVPGEEAGARAAAAEPTVRAEGETHRNAGLQAVTGSGGVFHIPADKIRTDERTFQMREGLDSQRVSDIAANMKRRGEFGDSEPLDVWRDPATGDLKLLSGHHRLAAAKEAGLDTVTAKVHDFPSIEEAADFARASNSTAKPLTPMEYGRAFKSEQDAGRSLDEIGKRHGGMSTDKVADHIALTDLPKHLQDRVQDGTFDPKKAVVLAKAAKLYGMPEEMQSEVFNYVVKRKDITPTQLKTILDTFAPAAMKQMSMFDGKQGSFDLGGGEALRGFTAAMDEYNQKLKDLSRTKNERSGIVKMVDRAIKEGRENEIDPDEMKMYRKQKKKIAVIEKQLNTLKAEAGEGKLYKTLAQELEAGKAEAHDSGEGFELSAPTEVAKPAAVEEERGPTRDDLEAAGQKGMFGAGEPEVKPDEERYVYHGTSHANASKIEASGRIGGKGIGSWFTHDPEIARDYAERHGGGKVFAVKESDIPYDLRHSEPEGDPRRDSYINIGSHMDFSAPIDASRTRSVGEPEVKPEDADAAPLTSPRQARKQLEDDEEPQVNLEAEHSGVDDRANLRRPKGAVRPEDSFDLFDSHTDADRQQARAETEREEMEQQLRSTKGDVSAKAGALELHSPLFRESEASGQKGLFGGRDEEPEVKDDNPLFKSIGSAGKDAPDTRSSIEALTESARSLKAEAKSDPRDRMKMGEQLAMQAEKAKDSVSQAFAGIKGSLNALWSEIRKPGTWTDLKDMTGKFSGAEQRAAWRLERFSKEIKSAVPDKLKREALTNWIQADGDADVLRERAAASTGRIKRGYEAALRLTDSETTLARNVQLHFEQTLQEAIDAGILEHGVDNYVTQLWQKENPVTKKLRAELNYSALQPNPSFAKKRVFDSYFEGEQAGYTPADKDVAFLISAHHGSFAKAISSRAYIRALLDGKASDGRPLAAVSGAGKTLTDAEAGDADSAYFVKPKTKPDETQDYRVVDHPALRKWKWADEADGKPIFVQGDVLIHPEAYDFVRNNLATSALRKVPLVRGVMNVSREAKQALLSFSGFHQVQEGLHAVYHGVNPFSPGELDLNQPDQGALVDHGLMVASFDQMQNFAEGLAANRGLINKVPGLGHLMQGYTDYLFKSYIPRLKMAMAGHALERNRKRYSEKLSDDQILELTANQANAAFGELNYRMLGRNPTMQDALKLSLLAPDFLEARGRFVGQALKPFGREQLMALALRNGLMTYSAMRILNAVVNPDHDPHWDKPFSVVAGDREYKLRTVAGDIEHLVTDPRSFIYNRLNPTTARTAIEFLTGRDSFGRRRDLVSQIEDAGKNLVPLPFHAKLNHNETDLWETVAGAMGLQTGKYRSAAETVAHKRKLESTDAPPTHKTQEEQDLMADYRHELDKGRLDADGLKRDVKAGHLTLNEARELYHEKNVPELARDFQRLSVEDALDVWDKSNDREREELRPYLAKKQALANRLPGERERLLREIKLRLDDEPRVQTPTMRARNSEPRVVAER